MKARMMFFTMLYTAVALGLLAPAAAKADSITDFAIFAVNNVSIPHASNIAGQIGSNNTIFTIDGNAGTPTSVHTMKANGKITLEGTTISVTGDILTNNTVAFNNPSTGTSVSGQVKAGSAAAINTFGANVVGGVTTGAGNFLSNPLATFTAATPIANNAAGNVDPVSGVLAPGAYDRLIGTGNLTFSAGNYGFTDAARSGGTSAWTMNVSAGDIFVYFLGNATLNGLLTVNVVGGDASHVHWGTGGNFTMGGGVAGGPFVNFAGSIIAANDINLGHETILTGTAWAGHNFTASEEFTQINIPGGQVPEPASVLLLGTGLVGLGIARRCRKAHRPS